MTECWQWWPEKRPTFAKLSQDLEHLVESTEEAADNYVQAKESCSFTHDMLREMASSKSDQLQVDRQPFAGTGYATKGREPLPPYNYRCPKENCDENGYLEPMDIGAQGNAAGEVRPIG